MDKMKQSCSTKIERKTLEKNRRDNMNNLFNKLNSLLPHSTSKKPLLSVSDQIDEAVFHIKTLEAESKISKEKKEKLIVRKRSYDQTTRKSKSPKIEINQTNESISVTLISGMDHHKFMFNDIICMLQEQGLDVVNATYSVVGNSVFHVIHAVLNAEATCSFGSFGNISERLTNYVSGCKTDDEKLRSRKYVNGSTSDEQHLRSRIWDYEIYPQTWEF